MTDLKPEDLVWLVSQKMIAHSGEGTIGRRDREAWNARIDRLFAAARAEGLRSPSGGGAGPVSEAGSYDLPERVTGGCADAGPCPHSPDMLAWLAEHQRLELDYGYDDEAEEMFWRVHERSGNINDREWDLIGQGATPLAALLSAKSYLESTSADTAHD